MTGSGQLFIWRGHRDSEGDVEGYAYCDAASGAHLAVEPGDGGREEAPDIPLRRGLGECRAPVCPPGQQIDLQSEEEAGGGPEEDGVSDALAVCRQIL
jgi:hypothetical protein